MSLKLSLLDCEMIKIVLKIQWDKCMWLLYLKCLKLMTKERLLPQSIVHLLPLYIVKIQKDYFHLSRGGNNKLLVSATIHESLSVGYVGYDCWCSRYSQASRPSTNRGSQRGFCHEGTGNYRRMMLWRHWVRQSMQLMQTRFLKFLVFICWSPFSLYLLILRKPSSPSLKRSFFVVLYTLPNNCFCSWCEPS